MKKKLANLWRPVFLWFPRRNISATAQGDEVLITWVWGRAYCKYSVFQGRYMGKIYSRTDI